MKRRGCRWYDNESSLFTVLTERMASPGQRTRRGASRFPECSLTDGELFSGGAREGPTIRVSGAEPAIVSPSFCSRADLSYTSGDSFSVPLHGDSGKETGHLVVETTTTVPHCSSYRLRFSVLKWINE